MKLPQWITQFFLFVYLLIAVPVRTIYWQIRLLGAPAPLRNPDDPYFDVICLSHVPWTHIWQRNHHTMMRLAKNRKVIYFQQTAISYIHWFVRHWRHGFSEYTNTYPGIQLVTPLFFPGQSRLPFVGALNRWIIGTQIKWLEHQNGLRNTVLWFYYPGSANVVDSFNAAAVVYDIQDEYTAFDWSPPDIGQRERHLLDRADIVFAGTHALYESKTVGFKGKAFFYPCAVEFSHFYAAAPTFDDAFFQAHPEISAEAVETIKRIDQAFTQSGESYGTISVPSAEAMDAAKGNTVGKYKQARVSPDYIKDTNVKVTFREPVELRDLRRPRLVYVGLIDKRIDPNLLAHLGQSHPEWEIVMIGPVDHKLFDQQSVEQAAPNVRFIGSVQYRWLPNFLSHCDVYLMPWIVNDLTRHINPTKTLEYMAAGKPVVSISLPDLENLFSDSVSLSTTYDEFVSDCEAALAGERWDKVARGLDRAWSFAWNIAVQEMEQHVSEAVTGHKTPDL